MSRSNTLEIMLRECGRKLEELQVARLFKVPEEMSQTPCDFFGYTTDGRAILLEAKMVNRTSLPIGKKPGLLPHQWWELDSADKARCISLICWMRGGMISIIPFFIAWTISKEQKSIPWSSCEPFRPVDLFDRLASCLRTREMDSGEARSRATPSPVSPPSDRTGDP